MKWISPVRVEEAINALSEWSQSAHTQKSQHLLPLVALLRRGARPGVAVRYEEADDKDFYDRHFHLEDVNKKEPYFDPLARIRRIETHPHSNASTKRKKTFAPSWKAAKVETRADGSNWWTLSEDWAEKVVKRVMTKGGVAHRVPVLDLAALLYRGQGWEDDATSRTVERAFRNSLEISDEDYESLFVFNDEDPAHLFTDTEPSKAQYDRAILESLVPSVEQVPSSGVGGATHLSPPEPGAEITDDDPVFVEVRELLALNSSGIILRGVPGVGKTWRARQIALKLVDGDDERIERVQFHPAYGYENFVEGFAPDPTAAAGFKVKPKVFLKVCDIANKKGRSVLIIDEINRGDPARVFGEALTYLERSYRDVEFNLAYSGGPAFVPSGLILIGTMNPYDRSIAQLDAAFIRRFDHVDVVPSGDVVADFLDGTSFTPEMIEVVQTWFEELQDLLPHGLGHAYFKDVKKAEHLLAIWRHRMLPACEVALEFEPPARLAAIKSGFNEMYSQLLGKRSTE